MSVEGNLLIPQELQQKLLLGEPKARTLDGTALVLSPRCLGHHSLRFFALPVECVVQFPHSTTACRDLDWWPRSCPMTLKAQGPGRAGLNSSHFALFPCILGCLSQAPARQPWVC